MFPELILLLKKIDVLDTEFFYKFNCISEDFIFLSSSY